MTKRFLFFFGSISALLLLQSVMYAQKADVSLLFGSSTVPSTTPANGVTQSFAGSFALQANLGIRLFHAGPASAFVEFPFTAIPSQSSTVDSGFVVSSPTGNLSRYFFAPGLRLQFGTRRLSPYLAAGAGFGRATVLNVSQLNSGTVAATQSRDTFPVVDVGGGMNVRLNRLLDLRFELRDYIRAGERVSESRNNLVPLAGIVLRF